MDYVTHVDASMRRSHVIIKTATAISGLYSQSLSIYRKSDEESRSAEDKRVLRRPGITAETMSGRKHAPAIGTDNVGRCQAGEDRGVGPYTE